MALAAIRQTGQKANSGRYSQHQERTVFDFICQFSECVTTEALGFIGDRLAHAGRTFSYAAHDAIQGIADEFTDVIRGTGGLVILHLKRLILLSKAKLETWRSRKCSNPRKDLQSAGPAGTPCNSSRPAALNLFAVCLIAVVTIS